MIHEKEIKIPVPSNNKHLLAYFAEQIQRCQGKDEKIIRFVITKTDSQNYYCEILVMSGKVNQFFEKDPSIFTFKKRNRNIVDPFNVALMIPTGIGAEIGGHAGDACCLTKLFGGLCDYVITHPNVVNASDINEMPSNTLYVEGSSLCRLLMGTLSLKPVLSNRILLAIDDNINSKISNISINALNAARATYGLNCPLIVKLSPSINLTMNYTSSGRASGKITNYEVLIDALKKYRNEYDAIALSTDIQLPPRLLLQYYESRGKKINPLGGIEALLSHGISLLFNVPAAHSPMYEGEMEELNFPLDPRAAAESISFSYLQCILKGLQRSPQLIENLLDYEIPGTISASQISCLILPDGCLGLTVLAALEQGIIVIAVKENKNLMANNLEELPWRPGQFYKVENYLEAAGILLAIKSGITPESIRRPFKKAKVVTHSI